MNIAAITQTQIVKATNTPPCIGVISPLVDGLDSTVATNVVSDTESLS